ncbi:E66L [African swine fever virus]|uniref:E66L n=1 Tax=African swine fever virus TaxID=10497 RepID=A0A8A1V773_ASF|nr:E66L [African swine fever virus]
MHISIITRYTLKYIYMYLTHNHILFTYIMRIYLIKHNHMLFTTHVYTYIM